MISDCPPKVYEACSDEEINIDHFNFIFVLNLLYGVTLAMKLCIDWSLIGGVKAYKHTVNRLTLFTLFPLVKSSTEAAQEVKARSKSRISPSLRPIHVCGSHNEEILLISSNTLLLPLSFPRLLFPLTKAQGLSLKELQRPPCLCISQHWSHRSKSNFLPVSAPIAPCTDTNLVSSLWPPQIQEKTFCNSFMASPSLLVEYDQLHMQPKCSSTRIY